MNQWVEPEAIGPERVRAFVVILKTRGCYWADLKGCSMCGYSKDTLGRGATPDELAEQLGRALARYRGEPYVKVYTSGSFLDDREVDAESRRAIVGAFSGKARRLLFETLPEFATPETLRPLKDAFAGEIEVALGLESTDPVILGPVRPQERGPLRVPRRRRPGPLPRPAREGVPPPETPVPHRRAKRSTMSSGRVREAADHFDALSVNPVHIQNGTVVEWLFHRGRYRPPWLWSVVESLKAGAALRGSARLVSFPTAGGVSRGPHNCGQCDARVLRAIEEASLSQEFAPLGGARVRVPGHLGGGAYARAVGGRGVTDLRPELPAHALTTIHSFLRAHALSHGLEAASWSDSRGDRQRPDRAARAGCPRPLARPRRPAAGRGIPPGVDRGDRAVRPLARDRDPNDVDPSRSSRRSRQPFRPSTTGSRSGTRRRGSG